MTALRVFVAGLIFLTPLTTWVLRRTQLEYVTRRRLTPLTVVWAPTGPTCSTRR